MSAARPLLLLSGKGGVGKTTVAAAAALRLAASGQRTLLVSTDPAHSTADVLGVPLGADPAEVGERLWAAEIDPEAAAEAHVAAIAEAAERSVDPELMPEVRRHLALSAHSPGTVESAAFERMVDLMATCPGTYDRVVFDTAPTGHTLRLLALPTLLTAWVQGLVRQRERARGAERMLYRLEDGADPAGDEVLARLHHRRARFQEAGRRLREDASFWLVLVPERLAIEETARAAATLEGSGLAVSGLVVNRLLPEEAEGGFLESRRAQQREYVDEIRRRFAGAGLVEVSQLPRDVTERAQLGEIGAALDALVAP